MTERVRVTIGLSYDGSGFHGFAPQPGQVTVSGEVCRALSELFEDNITCVCAGRTDVGVHATAQVIHVDVNADVLERRFKGAQAIGTDLPVLRRALSAKTPSSISVWRAMVMPASFDARHSATLRRYHYRIDCNMRTAPLRQNIAWQLGRPIDLAVLRLATDVFIGEHDFTAFCRKPVDKPCASLTRRVLDAHWKTDGPDRFIFSIAANAFCHQMVRSIVGTLVAVGIGQMRPSDVVQAMSLKTRSEMPTLAPAHGLCLVHVGYPDAYEALFDDPPYVE